MGVPESPLRARGGISLPVLRQKGIGGVKRVLAERTRFLQMYRHLSCACSTWWWLFVLTTTLQPLHAVAAEVVVGVRARQSVVLAPHAQPVLCSVCCLVQQLQCAHSTQQLQLVKGAAALHLGANVPSCFSSGVPGALDMSGASVL
jgi:hypothetical protein